MDPSASAAPPSSSFPALAHQLAIDEHLASRERDRSELDRDRSESARGGLEGSRSGISSPGETFLPTPSGSPPVESQSHGPGPKLSHLLHADHAQQNEHAQAYAPYQQQQQQGPAYPAYQAYGLSNLAPAQHYRAPLPPSYQSYPYNRGPPVPQMQHHSSGPPPPPPLLSGGPNSNGAGGYQSHSGPPSRTGTPNGTSQQQHQRQLQLQQQQQHQQQAQMMQNSRFGFPPIGSRQPPGVDMNLAPLSLASAPGLGDQGGPSWPPSSTSLNPYNREGPPIPQLGGVPALPPLASSVGGGPKRDRTEFDDELEQQDDEDDEGDEEEDDEWHEGTGSQSGAQKPKGGPKSAKKPKVVRQSLEDMAGGTSNGGAKQPVKKFTCPHASCGRAFARNFNLQSHIKSHMGVRDFKCPECPKSFSRRHDCARHCIAVHHYDKESGKKSAGAG